MYKIKCLIDNVEFTHPLKGKEKRKLAQHIKKNYNISYQEYVLKYFYDNVHPICACGCGNKTKFFKGVFFKYFEDHKNKIKLSEEQKEKLKKTRNNKYNLLTNRLKKLKISVEDLKKHYDEFCDFKTNFTNLEKTICIDKRTIKKYWIELGFINNLETFKRIVKKHQIYWQNKNDKAGGKKHLKEELLLNVYFFISNEKNKYTLKEIINKYNLNITELVLFKRLSEKFTEEKIKNLLKLGISSKPEMEFFNVLKFYFGKDVKKPFKLEGKIYDYILNNKVLIEFDGEYWHSLLKNKENDELKNKIAIKHGYKIFRVKEKNANDIEILLTLKKLAYEN
jgi:hypothetical protein